MGLKYYEKSKNNNSPIIIYKGYCNICNHYIENFEKDLTFRCSCGNVVSIDFAKDLNEEKIDHAYGSTLNKLNRGEVAYFINEGISEEDALFIYSNIKDLISNKTIYYSAKDIINFGKFKGKYIYKLDKEYIIWLINNSNQFALEWNYFFELFFDEDIKNKAKGSLGINIE